MCNLMDGEEKIVVGRATNGIRDEQEFCRKGMGIPKIIGQGYLEQDDAEHNVFRRGGISHQLSDLHLQ